MECCPKFNPQPWEDKVFEWKGKKFIKEKVFCFFHMPINFGSVISGMMKKIDKAGAKTDKNICLSDHTSKWNMDIYLAVDKDIPESENVKISGKFLSRVYEGNFGETGQWIRNFGDYAKRNNHLLKKMYMWYTTCPKCAKKYGKNYVVIVAEIG